LNGRTDLAQERISQTVADIVRVVETLTASGIQPDLRAVDNLKHLICMANDAEMQMELPVDAEQAPLRMKPIESGAAN
jgi:hypothetical protein